MGFNTVIALMVNEQQGKKILFDLFQSPRDLDVKIPKGFGALVDQIRPPTLISFRLLVACVIMPESKPPEK